MSSVGLAWYRDLADKRHAFHPHEVCTLVGASGTWQRQQTVCPSSSQVWAVLLETKGHEDAQESAVKAGREGLSAGGCIYAVFVSVVQGHLLVAHSAAHQHYSFLGRG